jgi:hypothetical protein
MNEGHPPFFPRPLPIRFPIGELDTPSPPGESSTSYFLNKSEPPPGSFRWWYDVLVWLGDGVLFEEKGAEIY